MKNCAFCGKERFDINEKERRGNEFWNSWWCQNCLSEAIELKVLMEQMLKLVGVRI
jgi:hypothetical protein